MLIIKTNEGRSKTMCEGDSSSITADCVIAAIQCMRTYAELSRCSEMCAQLEINQYIMEFLSKKGGSNNAE